MKGELIMTKNLRSILSALVAFVMVMTVGSFSSLAAETTYSIKINDSSTNHTYKAYQIFKGTYSNDKLSNIVWGNGVTPTSDSVDAETVAAYLMNNPEYPDKTSSKTYWGDKLCDYLVATAKLSADSNGDLLLSNPSILNSENGYTVTGLTAGYYLIVDEDTRTDNTTVSDEGVVYSSYMVAVVKNVEILPKKDVPTVTKKVQEYNDSELDTLEAPKNPTDWQDTADYDIGDDVPFQLKGTLPTDFGKYTTYAYEFHDLQSPGLTFKPGTVEVVADGKVVNTKSYDVKEVNSTDCTFEVVFENLKSIVDENDNPITLTASSEIIVNYKSTLNSSAKIGAEGNPNEVYLQFSNNPYTAGKGKTPKDVVKVFTFELVVNKTQSNPNFGVDGDNNQYIPLTGAGFALYKWDADRTGTPYAENADVEWALVNELLSTEDNPISTFTFSGLDDGKYMIVETQTPGGYNSIAPIVFFVDATIDDTAQTLEKLEITDGSNILSRYSDATDNGEKYVVTLANGQISTDILNKAGSTLPETGGMATS